MVDRNFGVKNLSPLGRNKVLDTFHSKEALSAFCFHNWGNLQDVVQEILPASNCSSIGCRLTWLKLYNLPLKFYHAAVIKSIARMFGDFIYLQDDLSEFNRLDMWTCLISTKRERISGHFNIQINGELVPFWVGDDDAFLSVDIIKNTSEYYSLDSSEFEESLSHRIDAEQKEMDCTNEISFVPATVDIVRNSENEFDNNDNLVGFEEFVHQVDGPVTKNLELLGGVQSGMSTGSATQNLNKKNKGRRVELNGSVGSQVSVSQDSSCLPDISNKNKVLCNVLKHHQAIDEVLETWKVGRTLGVFEEHNKARIMDKIKDIVQLP